MVSKPGHKSILSDKKKKRIIVEKSGSISSDNIDQLTHDAAPIDPGSSSSSDSGHHGHERYKNGCIMNGNHKHHPPSNGNVPKISQERWTSFNPFVINLQVDIVAWSLFAVALILRLWKLDSPRSIVFDELHYGRFISMYIRGIFFFDSQPPLGKQLISLAAYFGGYSGHGMNWTSIGAPYDESIPLKALRIVPAITGSLVVPVIYHLITNLGLSHFSAVIGCIFYLVENTFLTQSRFILMDMIQIFFSMAGLLFLIKARKMRTEMNAIRTKIVNQEKHESNWKLRVGWLFNLFLASTFLSFGLCVKFTGIYTLYLAVILVIYDFWWIIPDRSIKIVQLVTESIIYFMSFIVWPIVIYLLIFYIHLSWLTKAGPHDNVLTSAFQASLEGGLASITRGQPLEIVHGSQVTLRHTHGRTCWLHSHPQVYPVKYSDSRGSSHQQQVTCYSFKDVNNWWIIKKPSHDDLVVIEPLERIKHGDVIQLIHGITGRSLNSHDVAAPMSPAQQEVSCYIDYNISMPSQNLWKVDLINGAETNYIWHTIRSIVHLIHVNSSQALKFSGKQLPDWGFNQHEIVTDKVINQDDTIWNVEEHRYTKDGDAKDRERDLISAQFVPLETTQLGFWAKMRELQYKMIIGSDYDKVDGHMFSVDSPLAWLSLYQGIAYWVSTTSNVSVSTLPTLLLMLFFCLSLKFI